MSEEQVAVKCVSRELDASTESEVRVMRELAHPHVLRFIEYIRGEEENYIVMELAPAGDLFGVCCCGGRT